MNNATKTPSLLLFLAFSATLLFQGCTVSPKQPVYYPPPPAATKPEVTKPPVTKPLVPQVQPVKPPPPKQTSAIAADFSRQAEQATLQGRPDLAIAILERGLRAAPKEAMLWTQMAEVKLQQQQYEQARALAAKSNSLAGSDTAILQKNHWIIQESLKKAAGR
ncbi:tetratricopeptide repeat protein [Desulfocastanea catecholica]